MVNHDDAFVEKIDNLEVDLKRLPLNLISSMSTIGTSEKNIRKFSEIEIYRSRRLSFCEPEKFGTPVLWKWKKWMIVQNKFPTLVQKDHIMVVPMSIILMQVNLIMRHGQKWRYSFVGKRIFTMVKNISLLARLSHPQNLIPEVWNTITHISVHEFSMEISWGICSKPRFFQ